jgi:phytoene dehydrogenase-like protein
MLVEDTVHSTVDDAPLVNAALGITIRGAGLTRATGGMRGFWRALVAGHLGGAVVVCLGVPQGQVAGQEFTHHQLLRSYSAGLGEGNNMSVSVSVSVSAPGDRDSAPAGHRTVMLSTHTELERWEGLDDAEHARRRDAIGEWLVAGARRVYPRLGECAVVREVGTPVTYARYTSRPRGAVGGVRQRTSNANQHAVPHRLAAAGVRPHRVI